MKLLQLVLDNNRRKGAGHKGDDDNAADILERLKAGGDVEVLRKVLEELQVKEEEEDQLKLQIVRNQGSAEEGTMKRRKE